MAGVRSLNKVILIGAVQPKDPVISVGQSDRKMGRFTLVTKDGYYDKSNNWKETSEWHDIVAWGYVAEKVEKKVKRGSQLIVEGMITTNKWTDKNSGEEKARKVITASSITVLDAKGSQSSAPPDPEGVNNVEVDDLEYDDPF